MGGANESVSGKHAAGYNQADWDSKLFAVELAIESHANFMLALGTPAVLVAREAGAVSVEDRRRSLWWRRGWEVRLLQHLSQWGIRCQAWCYRHEGD